jgi:hypothetical protein
VRAVTFRMICIAALPRSIIGRSKLVPSVYTCLVFVQSLGGCSATERVNSRKARANKSRLAGLPSIMACTGMQQFGCTESVHSKDTVLSILIICMCCNGVTLVPGSMVQGRKVCLDKQSLAIISAKTGPQLALTQLRCAVIG